MIKQPKQNKVINEKKKNNAIRTHVKGRKTMYTIITLTLLQL